MNILMNSLRNDIKKYRLINHHLTLRLDYKKNISEFNNIFRSLPKGMFNQKNTYSKEEVITNWCTMEN